ncbi:MAG TPA: hypothetical protein DCP63_15905 [Bacteroidetes bacterium]|nr:hypothetical protein [Bacteroidota bacterium]
MTQLGRMARIASNEQLLSLTYCPRNTRTTRTREAIREHLYAERNLFAFSVPAPTIFRSGCFVG